VANEIPQAGTIGWIDLTVPDAERLRDFYSAVTGWKPQAQDMGGYSDFTMTVPGSGQPVSGVCHARGPNADVPPYWMIYIIVEDLDGSIARCVELGGTIVVGPKGVGAQGRYCVFRDPAGAVAALYESAKAA
jgi:predicted enzyme related to lactoylglutathione lyase